MTGRSPHMISFFPNVIWHAPTTSAYEIQWFHLTHTSCLVTWKSTAAASLQAAAPKYEWNHRHSIFVFRTHHFQNSVSDSLKQNGEGSKITNQIIVLKKYLLSLPISFPDAIILCESSEIQLESYSEIIEVRIKRPLCLNLSKLLTSQEMHMFLSP